MRTIYLLIVLMSTISCTDQKSFSVLYYSPLAEFYRSFSCKDLKKTSRLTIYTDTIYISSDIYKNVKQRMLSSSDSCVSKNPVFCISLDSLFMCIHSDGTSCNSDIIDSKFIFQLKLMSKYYELGSIDYFLKYDREAKMFALSREKIDSVASVKYVEEPLQYNKILFICK